MDEPGIGWGQGGWPVRDGKELSYPTSLRSVLPPEEAWRRLAKGRPHLCGAPTRLLPPEAP